MRLGIRGHDILAESPKALCEKLASLGISEIQLVAHKSFPNFTYSMEEIESLACIFREYGIRVAVYGCYIDPLTTAGQERFLEHIRYAAVLGADAIATESGVGYTDLQEDEVVYRQLVTVFRRFAEAGKVAGVPVAIETVSVHPICSPERTKRLLNDVANDNLYVILDPVNLDPMLETEAQYSYSESAIALYGDRIIAVHWKNPEIDLAHPAVRLALEKCQVVLMTEGLHEGQIVTIANELAQ